MRRARELACLGLALFAAGAVRAEPLAVDAVNASVPTSCAEHDNVYVKLVSPRARRLRIEAAHPAYLRRLKDDNMAPDFSTCDMSGDPVHRAAPRQVVLHDGGRWQLRGFAYPSFWRAGDVPVRVGARVETGLHLLQLWTRGRVRDEEVLVLYPADGYWRARPLAPLRLGWTVDPTLPTAYGSSFLIGPIEEQQRPFVDLASIAFDPDRATFRLVFARGGAAVLKIAALDERRIALDIALSQAVAQGPFAALRSMYVTDDNADASRLAWRGPDGRRQSAPVMRFTRARARELWAGRTRPSRHNTSAPDLVFGKFRAR